MGQYHSIYNLTKKEMLIPHRLDDGAKLLEWGNGGMTTAALAVLLCNSNGRGGGDLSVYGPNFEKRDELQSYINEIAGRWSGDKIVVQGDYAKKDDPAYISEAKRKKFTDISLECVRALLVDDHFRSMAKEGYDKAVKHEAELMDSYIENIDARIAKEKKKAGAK